MSFSRERILTSISVRTGWETLAAITPSLGLSFLWGTRMLVRWANSCSSLWWFSPRGWQTTVYRLNPARGLSCGLLAKNSFYVFKWLKKIKRIIFWDTWKLFEIQISVSMIKLYWNRASLICLCIVCGCFGTPRVVLGNCHRVCMAGKAENIYCLALSKKNVPIPDLTQAQTTLFRNRALHCYLRSTYGVLWSRFN